MKLGKALATGIAEERPQGHDEELVLTEGITDIQDVEASAPEDVPAPR